MRVKEIIETRGLKVTLLFENGKKGILDLKDDISKWEKEYPDFEHNQIKGLQDLKVVNGTLSFPDYIIGYTKGFNGEELKIPIDYAPEWVYENTKFIEDENR